MARPEAIKNLLYYPTPVSTVKAITEKFSTKVGGHGVLLDPCAGTGEAGAALAKSWGLKFYGIELHAGRARELEAVADQSACASYANIDSSVRAQVLFLNPPYDYERIDDDTVSRQELSFLIRSTEHLTENGLLVFIPPASLLRHKDTINFLSKNFKEFRCFRFQDGEYEAFSQLIIIARRQHASYYRMSDATEKLQKMAETPINEAPPWEFGIRGWYDEADVPELKVNLTDHAARPPLETMSGAWSSRSWLLQTDESFRKASAPLSSPRPGHTASLLAAGALNGCQVGNLLVKGGSEKKQVKETRRDGSVAFTERIVSHLSTLDLTTGVYDTWNVGEDVKRTAKWFSDHGDDLASAIEKSFTPQFDGDLSDWQSEIDKLKPPGVLPGHSEPCWIPEQLHSACAVAYRWRQHKNVILAGEQGTGKTAQSIIATSISGFSKVVVICPSHLTKKWLRDSAKITQQKCAMIAKTVSDCDRFFADPEMRYLIVSKETAKLGGKWRRSAAKARYRRKVFGTFKVISSKEKVPVCPSCGALIDEPNKRKKTRCPAVTHIAEDGTKTICNSPLWENYASYGKTGKRGKDRFPLASYISHKFTRRYALIVDECHQYAGASTDQSQAVQKLLSSSVKSIMMTGTLYGGRASSLFHLLYKCEESFREIYKYTEAKRFSQHHGLFERVYKEEDYTSRSGWSKGRTGGKLREIPGMSPEMIVMLIPYTVFVKLSDLSVALPEYTEEMVFLEPDPDVSRAANSMAEKCLKVMKEYPAVLGAYLQACLGYPDRCDQREDIYAFPKDMSDEDKERLGHAGKVLVAGAPALPDAVYPKDDWVVERCVQEKSEGRGVMVFTTQNHRRGVQARLKRRLEDAGLRLEILEASVSPEKREEWLVKARKRGFDVLLTNGKLVETGLDILEAVTIIQYGTEFSLSTLRQSIRRSWRIGQDRPVRVFMLAQERTMQESAAKLIASKMRAAEAVDGDEAGGLAQVSSGENLLVEIAMDFLEKHAK